jgi:hypothetical protein
VPHSTPPVSCAVLPVSAFWRSHCCLVVAWWLRRFLAGSDSDSDSDEDRRVVLKSAKDKRFSELTDSCDEIRVSDSSSSSRGGSGSIALIA